MNIMIEFYFKRLGISKVNNGMHDHAKLSRLMAFLASENNQAKITRTNNGGLHKIEEDRIIFDVEKVNLEGSHPDESYYVRLRCHEDLDLDIIQGAIFNLSKAVE